MGDCNNSVWNVVLKRMEPAAKHILCNTFSCSTGFSQFIDCIIVSKDKEERFSSDIKIFVNRQTIIIISPNHNIMKFENQPLRAVFSDRRLGDFG